MDLPSSCTTWFSQYVFLIDIKSVARLFWFPYCSPGCSRYLYKPSSASAFSSGYIWSSLAVSSLIASFDYMSIINDFVLFVLYTILVKFLTQIFDIFFRDLKLLSIHRRRYMFSQLFVKGFHKDCVSLFVSCSCSLNINIVFFKQLCQFTFKNRPIIT